MRFVPIKNEAQLDLQALHQMRDRWTERCTTVNNQIRGLLLKHGITVSIGTPQATDTTDLEDGLSPTLTLVAKSAGEGCRGGYAGEPG